MGHTIRQYTDMVVAAPNAPFAFREEVNSSKPEQTLGHFEQRCYG
jgi:hypothetical protein